MFALACLTVACNQIVAMSGAPLLVLSGCLVVQDDSTARCAGADGGQALAELVPALHR